MADSNVLSDIESAIRSALQFHRLNPFRILREVGAVADLRDRIRSGLSLREPARARLPRDSRYRYSADHVDVDRLQLEVSIRHHKPRFRKSIDMAILRQEPCLAVGNFGPGDVLEQFRIEDIDVAIEIKTSQSSDPASRANYVQNIRALLRLRQLSLDIDPNNPAHGYFVLIDRNDPVYGQWGNEKRRMNWQSDSEQRLLFRKRDMPNLWVDGGLGACGLAVSGTKPVKTDVWVRCFILDSSREDDSALYVFMKDGRPPAQLMPYVVCDDAEKADPASE